MLLRGQINDTNTINKTAIFVFLFKRLKENSYILRNNTQTIPESPQVSNILLPIRPTENFTIEVRHEHKDDTTTHTSQDILG